jgi:hypothetical protein
MNILALKVVISDQELTELTNRELRSSKAPLRDVAIRCGTAGIRVTGSYHMLMPITFDTLWSLSVVEGRTLLNLTELKVSGFAADAMRSVMLQAIKSNVPFPDAVTVQGNGLLIDQDRAMAEQGVPFRSNLRSVTCEDGLLRIEAGSEG